MLENMGTYEKCIGSQEEATVDHLVLEIQAESFIDASLA